MGEPPGAGDATELFDFLCLFVSGPNDAVGQVALGLLWHQHREAH